MKYYFVFFTLLLFLTLTTLLTAQTESGSFEFEGYTRNYVVFLPQNYEENMPIVLNLHGYTDNAIWQMEYSAMNDVADTAGFIVVYPDAIPPGFNTGLFIPGWPPLPTHIDDVGFISALIDTIEAHYNIDTSRIYSCGFSNGGIMTYKLIGELGHRFAAAASVSGLINNNLVSKCKPIRSLPIIHIHGTKDLLAKWTADVNENSWGVEETINFWLEKNKCSLEADSIALADTCKTDSCHIEKIIYSNCSEGSCFLFYKVIDGGHSWPGSESDITWSTEGHRNRDINANVEIWNFFKNYENPYADIAACDQIKLDSKYIQPAGDTLNIVAHVTNPNDHPITVTAKINGLTSAFNDSIQLTTDGYGEDMMEGSFISSDLEEEIFAVRVFTKDHSLATTQCLHKIDHFTTIGPVVLDSYTITSSDTFPNPANRLKFQFTLKNQGLTAIAKNITTTLICLDTCASPVGLVIPKYGEIAPGKTSPGDKIQYILFSKNCPTNTYVRFRLDIASNGYIFWSDTFSVFIYPVSVREINGKQKLPSEFMMHQNYPNPFNPTTVIKYDLPRYGLVRLVIYDLLGRHIRTLVDTQQPAGRFQTIWDGTDEHNMKIGAGVYFCRLEAGDFVKVIKMALVK